MIARILLVISGWLLGFGSASAQYGTVEPVPEKWKPGFDSITMEQAQDWLSVLAGPNFEGRGTGQEGYAKAAHWVAGQLAELDLKPVGDNGTYFQMLPMKRRQPMTQECFIELGTGLKIPAQGNLGLERFTDQQETLGALVFLRIVGDSELPSDLSLRDKIVIYSADEKIARNAQFQLARKRPAVALKVISESPRSRPQLIRDGGRRRATSVTGTIINTAADQLIAAAGKDANWFTDFQAGLDSFEAEVEATLRLRFQEEPAAVPNVVAWLEGSDPVLKDEYVVIGSHLDHLGIQGGVVHPGADDNGSGSTAVLSVAKAFAVNPSRPKRSILFIWFAAEEIGLVGSKHYTNYPTMPLEGMTCMFNMDMVGRNEETKDETSEENEGSIHLVGSQRGETKLHDLILEANRHVGFRFEMDMESVWNRSDQVNFYNKGVPVAFLFGGFHPDYHRPGDQVTKINFKKLASAARLYYLAVNLAAEFGKFDMKIPAENQ
ncbi:MAG: M20/M25/M40 family metallo-hydrolase [Planctomycetota bacterium]